MKPLPGNRLLYLGNIPFEGWPPSGDGFPAIPSCEPDAIDNAAALQSIISSTFGVRDHLAFCADLVGSVEYRPASPIPEDFDRRQTPLGQGGALTRVGTED